jgi:hypothetical protein
VLVRLNPAAVVTTIGPAVAPIGAVAVICISLFTTKGTEAPLNVTDVAPEKPLPVIVTVVALVEQPADGLKVVRNEILTAPLPPIPPSRITEAPPDALNPPDHRPRSYCHWSENLLQCRHRQRHRHRKSFHQQ